MFDFLLNHAGLGCPSIGALLGMELQEIAARAYFAWLGAYFGTWIVKFVMLLVSRVKETWRDHADG